MINGRRNESHGNSQWVVLIAVASLVGCLLAGWYNPVALFKSWLAAAMLAWSISIGSLALMLTYCLTGGHWGRAVWPWLVVTTRLMSLVALLFVPWGFGISTIYPWANSDLLTQYENTQNRQWLFQTNFFIGRTALYFFIWLALSCLVAGWPWSRMPACSRKIWGGQAVAGLGLIAILLTVTWAGIDWVMSFDPFFTSTLFGALIGVGAMLATVSALVAARAAMPQVAASSDAQATSDLSNLLLTFLMMWAYFSFAHLLIMWTGDLPIEAGFYAARRGGVWIGIVPALALLGFFVPFFCLFSRNFKRSPPKVAVVALGLLAVRQIELWWMVMPAAGETELKSGLHWSIVPSTVLVVVIYGSMLRLAALRLAAHRGTSRTVAAGGQQ